MRLGHPLGQLHAVLGRRAQRGDAPGEQPAGRDPRARAARAAPSRWSLSASYGLRALAAQLEAAQRPGQLVAVRARGGRRGCRTRAARPPARRTTTSIPCGRPPAPSATVLQASSPPARAHASAPSVTRPSPNRRSARSRSRSTLAHARVGGLARTVSRRPAGDAVSPSPADERLRADAQRSASGVAIVQSASSACSSGEAIVSPCSVATSVTGRARSSARRAPGAPARRARRSRAQLEVGLLGEHVVQQRAQRARARACGAALSPRRRAPPRACARRGSDRARRSPRARRRPPRARAAARAQARARR